MLRSQFLRCVPVGIWAVACSDSGSDTHADGAQIRNDGAGGQSAEGGQSTAGSSPGSRGGETTGGETHAQPAGSSGATSTNLNGSAGAGTHSGGTTSGQAGSTASSGGSSSSLACSADLGAVASPADFSINTETGAPDQHSLLMKKADIIRRVLTYTTSGPADHQHEFQLSDDELVALLAGQTITVSTQGPPLNAATGHTHSVTIRSCAN